MKPMALVLLTLCFTTRVTEPCVYRNEDVRLILLRPPRYFSESLYQSFFYRTWWCLDREAKGGRSREVKNEVLEEVWIKWALLRSSWHFIRRKHQCFGWTWHKMKALWRNLTRFWNPHLRLATTLMELHWQSNAFRQMAAPAGRKYSQNQLTTAIGYRVFTSPRALPQPVYNKSADVPVNRKSHEKIMRTFHVKMIMKFRSHAWGMLVRWSLIRFLCLW